MSEDDVTDAPLDEPEPDLDSDQGPARDAQPWTEGLRERKKRLTRALISDTATGLFLERGFDDVTVAEVADAAGVSEKTVFNYFPTKESLLFDREPDLAASIWRALGPGAIDRSPVDAMVRLLHQQVAEMSEAWEQDQMASFRRFSELVEATPELQTAQREMSERIEQTAAEALAARADVSPSDPETRIAAGSLMALMRVFYDGIRRSAREGKTPQETRRIVMDEVHRAARVVESGLWWFGLASEDNQKATSQQQFKSAAEAAQAAGRQLVLAIRQARSAWEQLHRDSDGWKHDLQTHQDEWKQAYRDQQAQRRQLQRELQEAFRQGKTPRGRARGRGRPGNSIEGTFRG